MPENQPQAERSPAVHAGTPPEPEEVRRQIERILVSRLFSRAQQLRRFISYIVDETLAGGNGRLKEYTIGLEVFERDSSYDPRIDPVVRVQAMRLRSKLDEYYATTGRDDPVLIELAKGSYVPVITERATRNSAKERTPGLRPAPIVRRFHGLPARVLVPALGALILAALGAIAVFRLKGSPLLNRSGFPSNLRQLTSDPGLTTDPAVSHDGQLIAYSSDRGGRDSMELWLQQTGSADSIPLTHDGMNNVQPSFSPDGTKIVFRSDRDGGGIFVMPTLGGESRLLARQGRDPRFSPDGRWVAYWTGEPHTHKMSGRRAYVVDVNGGTPKEVGTSFPGESRFGVSFPNWLPDGRHLLLFLWNGKGPADWFVLPFEGGIPAATGLVGEVFSRGSFSLPVGNAAPNLAVTGGSIVFSARKGDSTNIWRIRMAPRRWQPDGAPERLTFGSATEVSPSAGGGRVGFVSSSFDADIWTLPVQANTGTVRGELRRVVQGPARDLLPSASEPGDKIAYVSDRTGIPELWLRDVEKGTERKLTDGLRVDSPCLSRDGRQVAFSIRPKDPEKEKLRIGILKIDGQGDVVFYGQAGGPADWSADGQQLLLAQAGQGSRSVGLLEPSSGRFASIVQPPGGDEFIFRASFSPDNRWMAFYVLGPSRRALYLAPFQGFSPSPVSEWNALSESHSSDAWPQWSPDGRLLYFLSDRDGHRCIWALPIDPNGHPAGEARAVQHFHSVRLSMNNLENPGLSGFGVRGDAMFLALGERRGNIWMLTLPEQHDGESQGAPLIGGQP